MELNIALIGSGRMGKEIRNHAEKRGHQIISVFDENHRLQLDLIERGTDIFIDFSVPSAVLDNFRIVAKAQKPIVIGTTGWDQHKKEILELANNTDIGVIYASNFSIGMNIFFKMAECAARLFDGFPDYDPFIHEIHHRQKVDSPSGTALTLGEILLEGIHRKKKLQLDKADGKIAEDELHISSTRAGYVPGTHLVGFDSDFDTIEIKHTVRNRSGFAVGAIYAAEWLIGKKGFFSIRDMFNELYS
jgi:4-hydroxy-tetrahydrodipicolinate reductase